MSAQLDHAWHDFAARVQRQLSEPAGGSAGAATLAPLAGDGSTRRIYRARFGEKSAIAVVNPLPTDRAHPDENENFLAVRDHLARRGVRVPACYAADTASGFLLLEDLGDLRLYDCVRSQGWRAEKNAGTNRCAPLRDLYAQAIDFLIRMQADREPRFDVRRVSNPPYNADFVVSMEARYFHTELVCGWARRDHDFAAIADECASLAHGATAGAAAGFMHRDYQSRNLMVLAGALVVIDFQGARLGPGEYDLAALLYDPYVAMPVALRDELRDDYAREARRAGVPGMCGDADVWRMRFLANAANRLMQALGAFAKLGGRLGRPDFLEHVPAALLGLDQVLHERGGCPKLLALVRELRVL